MLKRFFEINRNEGLKVAVYKAFKYGPVIITKNIGKSLFKVNSKRYWDYRLLLNWSNAGGSAQSLEFAESLFEAVDFDQIDFKSVLDFGCALGDSVPVFRRHDDKSQIYLWDLSSVGLSRAVRLNQSSGALKWDGIKKVDFVYCSNVIEHALDTASLVHQICSASNKWVCIQAPYREFHADGERISPSRPNGEHIWTIDDEFINKFLKLPLFEFTNVVTRNAPNAWPFGEQVYFIGRLRSELST